MSVWNAIAPALILICAGSGIASMAINLRKARTIEDTPTAKIRSAAQGYLSISGIARGIDNDPVIAPLTGQHCLWYHYTIERRDRDGKHSRWTTVESGRSEKFFALDDRTGICHIDPRRADVTAVISRCWQGSERRPPGPPRRSPSAFGFLSLFSREYRYREHRIHPDEWVYVLGWFETVHGPSLAERTEVQTKQLLNVWKQDREALLARFDLNRDGEICLREWERARRAARQQAQHDVRNEPTAPAINVVSRSPLRNQPYLIGTRDPHAIAGKYRRNAMISLLAGFAFAAFLFWKFYGY